jgi:hypothetical protein
MKVNARQAGYQAGGCSATPKTPQAATTRCRWPYGIQEKGEAISPAFIENTVDLEHRTEKRIPGFKKSDAQTKG